MLLNRLVTVCLIVAAAIAVTHVTAQAPSASTAGVPASQNVGNGATSTNVPPGQGGTSTGTSIGFQGGSTAVPPASTVVSTSLTGAAASEASASLSTQSAQNLGSNGMYTSTTGGAISGISTGIPGGYNEATPSATGSITGNRDAGNKLEGAINWMVAGSAALVGVVFIL